MTSPFSCGYLLMLILKNNLKKKNLPIPLPFICVAPAYVLTISSLKTMSYTLLQCFQELARALLIGQNLIYVQLCLLDPGIGMVAGFYQTAFLKYTISKTLFRNNFSVTALRWRYVIFRKFKICVLIFIAVMMVSFSPSLTYLKGNTNIDFMLMATCV